MTFYSEIERVADRVFGEAGALDQTDAILAQMILEFVRSRPALGKADTVALNAVNGLSQHDPEFARSLMAELMQGM